MLRAAATLALPAGLALCTLVSPGHAEAKARYMDLPEAVQTATAIAIVHTEASAPCEITGEHWTYSQKVFAEPKNVLKGELTSPFELLAEKDFICATVHYEAPADYLVMIHPDGKHLTTLNHGWGALRIEGAQVQWPYGSEDTIPVEDAVAQIQALVGAPPEAEPQPEAVEPMPCGYAVSYMDREREREEKAQTMWRIAGAAGVGGAAVMLGFVFGFRRRRRS